MAISGTLVLVSLTFLSGLTRVSSRLLTSMSCRLGFGSIFLADSEAQSLVDCWGTLVEGRCRVPDCLVESVVLAEGRHRKSCGGRQQGNHSWGMCLILPCSPRGFPPLKDTNSVKVVFRMKCCGRDCACVFRPVLARKDSISVGRSYLRRLRR